MAIFNSYVKLPEGSHRLPMYVLDHCSASPLSAEICDLHVGVLRQSTLAA